MSDQFKKPPVRATLRALRLFSALKSKMTLFALASSLALSACSATSDWASGSKNCRQIGCGQGLVFYPNEKLGAKRQAKDWYGWSWAKTSSAYSPDDPKHWELKAKEVEAGQTPWHWNNQNINQ